MVILSQSNEDHQKGLLNAVTTIFPKCERGFRGGDIKELVDVAAYG
jgi:hypothetical protein